MISFPRGNLNLFVIEVGEPSDLTFRVLVAEGLLGEAERIDLGPELEGVELGTGRPIQTTAQSRMWEFHWDQYVAYCVRNESYWAREEGEPAFESHFYQRQSTAFLNYVRATTFAGDNYPGPLSHWGIDTHNHCISVVSHVAPTVRGLDVNDRVQALVGKGWLERQ